MENLLKDSMSNSVDVQEVELQDVKTKHFSDMTISDKEREIEIGNLQDYLNIFGEFIDNL
ncbi:MAG: hypothetical protein KA807_05240 [Prolixibacteraceae bacterium]|nr:hypothetical protein [Prolixibacteraceae bacterium]